MAEKKMEVTIEGKYVLAVFDVPKSNMRELEGRRILQGVHVRVDKGGDWMVEATDSYKLAQVSRGYKGGKCAWFDFTLPPETVAELKATDLLTFEPDMEKMRCKLTRLAKGNLTEWEFNLLEGKYPNTDQLVPDGQPMACYRYAHSLNADHIGVLMGVVKKALGKGEQVVFSTQEGKPNRPVVGYAGGDGVEVTLLVMPVRMDDHHKLGNPRPVGKDEKAVAELVKERDELKANADMWKTSSLAAQDKVAALKNEVAELKKGGGSDEVEKLKAELKKWQERARQEKAKRVEEKGDDVKKLSEELKKVRAELDAVWKENAALKAKPKHPEQPAVPPAPKAEPSEDAAAVVSLETMQAWCKERSLLASQKNDAACIWVEGESKPYAEELNGMGFKFSRKRKSWYFDPKWAA